MAKSSTSFKKGNAAAKKESSEKAPYEVKRSTDWTFLAYPDSAPSDWQELLRALHTPTVISPLHDADVHADESQKKAHWHVLLIYASLKSYNQVREDIAPICGSIPQLCKNKQGMLRYFVHMDSPDKHQYAIGDMVCFSGANLEELMPLSKTDSRALRRKCVKEMRDYITANNITEFSDLFDYACDNNADWYDALLDNSTYVMSAYVKSSRHRLAKQREQEIIQHQNNTRAWNGMAVDESEIQDVYPGEGVLPPAWDVETETIDPITGEIITKEAIK